MPKKMLCISLAAALLSSSAQAAMLTDISGAVMVDKGGGFVPAVGNVVLSSGDRIRVDDGSAVIDYGRGCSVVVGRAQVVAVVYEPPCAGTPAGGLKDGVTAGDPGVSTGTLVVGGLLVGGAIAGGIAISAASP